MALVTVTDSARDYLAQLIEKQDVEGMGVRIFVTQPGTKHAETCLAYCPPNEIVPTDEQVDLEKFTLFLDHASVPFLEDAYVDYAKDQMGGQLTIKAPNAKVPNVDENAPLPDRINYVLASEINPGLASHGGDVALVEVVDESVAVLRFGGGCQGCSAVSLTLKQGVESTLKERVPEITAVRDVTDHSVKDNAYYQ
ncbi:MULTISPECIES: Fe-S biogenesis protein NfuA [Marinobacter]|uniref:Fe/S biogenesis protein NfuA n=1 Tax=Marinobacter xestospongiae TaxID=994319 RepID=A0ABU3VZX7_9GAMM|nr:MULTISPECIES: Fe-S biogenesis protein NfuA [Marinobacter]MDV2079843.1 Fe-S biogenesis protein NfuA [Marinobacter xestospongiae]UDL07162.1 Fe-S biogenesis protein NfuA [Marinobacter sp. CA1]